MTITCNQLDGLLYEGDAASIAAAEAHARECRACSDALEAWNDITATAPGLRHSWESDLLVPRALKAMHSAHPARGRTRLLQVAAALLLTISLGVSAAWIVLARSNDAEFDRAILRISAVEEVERAERAHLEAIQQLEAAAAPKLRDAESPLMISYSEKLTLLDEAIAECEMAIERNRQNAFLRRQLLTMLTDKRTTLQDVVREDTNVPAN